MKFLIPFARTFLLPKHHQNVEQPSPDSSKLLDTRQFQGGSATRHTPLDSYLMILIALYIDILAITLMIIAAPPMRQYNDDVNTLLDTIPYSTFIVSSHFI